MRSRRGHVMFKRRVSHETFPATELTVCPVHMKFVPCRPCFKDPQQHSTDSADIERVRQYQNGGCEGCVFDGREHSCGYVEDRVKFRPSF
jgi:hypothetical protein